MQRTHIGKLKEMTGKEVSIAGWVDVRRDHGKLIFIDLRDASGKVQMVALPNHKEAHEIANKLRTEWVISVSGKVNERPPKMVNKDEPNGTIEIEIMKIEVLNEAETPPFDISGGGQDVNEESRLKYKYIDLRRPRLQKNIRNRHKVMQFMRNYFTEKDFVEIETPILTKSTPEGARDYIVPSRLDKGKFYALPQSPQQYKQLLMTAGMERYFQFPKCMRDEDTRGDRQPEFTQLDLEMSFTTQDEVMALNEDLLISIVKTLYPEKKIQEIPFPRLTYKEAMDKYKTDRPDLRKDKDDPNLLAFCWVIDFPFFEKVDKEKLTGLEKGEWTFTHNPFSRPQEKYSDWVKEKKNISEILTQQYDVVLNGYEIGGGSIRNHKAEDLLAVFEILGYKKDEVERNFGHMLKAFRSGTPPHGGIAWGFDRLIMILQNEPNIREVIAFPKTGEGKDPMMDSPSEVSEKQLRELGIEVKKRK